MILNIIFSYLNAIVLGVWVLFLLVVAVRYFQPSRSKINPDHLLFRHLSKIGYKLSTAKLIKKSSAIIVHSFAYVYNNLYLNSFITNSGKFIKSISYTKLIVIAIGLNIFYGIFVTWGQYYVWSTSSDFTRALLSFPLPAEVPFPAYLEWIRPLFERNYGYFFFYIWGRVWLDIFILFVFSGVMYFVFRTWKFYRGGFLEKGPELMLILMLISGWMGVLVSLSVGFIFAILWIGFSLFKGKKIVAVEPAFIFATFFALLFYRIILSYF